MSHRVALGALMLATLVLSGCQSLSGWRQDPLRTEAVVKTAHEPGCEGDACAVVEADYLRFPESPELSALLQKRLFALASGLSDDPNGSAIGRATSFDDFAGQVFAAAKEARREVPELPGYAADLDAKVIAEHDDLLVIELDGYLFSGGAHGLPLTQYLVIDRNTREPVSLAEMLKPGQRAAYDAALARAHQRWLQTDQAQGLSAQQWPFVISENVAPLKDALAVKYQVYDLAPYAVGQPVLTIPYADLEGIFRPRYLP
ncbi:DUF3298 and DUF4163 domain-containing protein [Salinicola sp. RZ23]|uniref:DUF3298 and DUF4163 domain-containing protein n=1 Tax=Salinicola sp. RZ23 TaxID=1949087 RepID=UPI001300A91D|nr:DUF3298 and DUF4163 domain-containing protein [Salinicola sp. RZ23]